MGSYPVRNDDLGIFHFVVAGMTGVMSLLPIFHLIFGVVLAFAPAAVDAPEATPMMVMGGIFTLFAAVVIMVGLTFSVMIACCGWCIVKRKRHGFCMVMAGVECMVFPFGTILGVFTIIVLSGESVRELFAGAAPAAYQ